MPTPSYTHPRDTTQLTKLFETMQFNSTSGKPELRVSISEGIEISGNVNIPGTVTIASGGTIGITNFPATQAVSIASMPTTPVTGTFWQATQPVSGSVTASVSGSISVSNFPATQPVSIASMPTTPVTGTFWQATQPVSGPLTDTQLRATAVPVSGTVEVNNDSGNPLPISKNITVNSEQNPIYVESSNVSSTSKDRMKITSYSTGFFNTFQHSKAPDVWDETLTTGGTSTHDNNRNAVAIAVTATPGSKVIRQTRQVMRYVPGRPAEYSQAVIIGAYVSGVRTRVGQFDEADGFFLERATTGIIYAVVRSSVTGSPVETRIAQSSWNGDKLDGTGSSGVTLDLTKTQLLVVDYEWYGTGAVQFSFVINNQTIKAHTFYHANVISNPWCSTPFIPMRVELENVSATATASMIQISSCHSMEALSDNLGFPLSIATAISGKSLTTANTYYPVLSIRLKSTQINSVVIPQYLQAGTLDNTFINYQLLLNATLTGASFVNHPTPESAVQYDVSATAVTGGTILNQGFAAAGYNDRLSLNENAAAGNFQIGRSSLGTVSDILTIVIAAGTSNKSGIAVMNWTEQR